MASTTLRSAPVRASGLPADSRGGLVAVPGAGPLLKTGTVAAGTPAVGGAPTPGAGAPGTAGTTAVTWAPEPNPGATAELEPDTTPVGELLGSAVTAFSVEGRNGADTLGGAGGAALITKSDSAGHSL